jgi:hypothetical protein
MTVSYLPNSVCSRLRRTVHRLMLLAAFQFFSKTVGILVHEE